MRVKTFIVNLKDSTARRARVLEETSGLPFMDIEFIEAIDGRRMSGKEMHLRFDVRRFVNNYQRPPAGGEIGCVLSHRLCYERLLASDEPYALIFEDDIFFPSLGEVESVIGHGIRLLREEQADLVLFVPDLLYYNIPREIDGKYTAYPVRDAYCTFAYLINRKGAERLLKERYPGVVADDFRFMRRLGVRIQCIYPCLVMSTDSESLIGEEREKLRKAARKRSFLWSLRMYADSICVILLMKCRILVGRGSFA